MRKYLLAGTFALAAGAALAQGYFTGTGTQFQYTGTVGTSPYTLQSWINGSWRDVGTLSWSGNTFNLAPTPLSAGTAAATGSVGEVLSSTIATGSAVAMSSGASGNITSKALTAGNWLCWGTVVTKPASGTTTSLVKAGLSTTTATLPTSGTGGYFEDPHAVAADGVVAANVGPYVYNLSSTTTLYLVANTTFAVSTMGAFGGMWCQRTF